MKKLIAAILALWMPLAPAYALEQEYVSEKERPELQGAVLNEELRKINKEIETAIQTGDTASLAALTTTGAGNFNSVKVGSPTGGNQGAGTVNATALYDDGVLLTQSKVVNLTYTMDTTDDRFIGGTIPRDDTKPQSTEGNQLFTHSHTPASSTNILYIFGFAHLFPEDANATATLALFKDSDTDALAVGYEKTVSGIDGLTVPVIHKMTAGTTSAITFKLRAGSTTGNTGYNQDSTTTFTYGGLNGSWLFVIETTP